MQGSGWWHLLRTRAVSSAFTAVTVHCTVQVSPASTASTVEYSSAWFSAWGPDERRPAEPVATGSSENTGDEKTKYMLDIFHFTIKVKMEYVQISNSNMSNGDNLLRKLLQDIDFSDVTLVTADSQHIPAHRYVLNANSPFLT